ncbi:MAG: hypothetical protein NTU69_11290 [Proteobacteria bacterium]|nr:hypothetical protein [Pseudomonadota bacterium]
MAKRTPEAGPGTRRTSVSEAGKFSTVKPVRDARSRQYVKKEEAKKRPATTVTERDKIKKK